MHSNSGENHRKPLSISSLVNDESIDPIQQHHLTPNHPKQQHNTTFDTWSYLDKYRLPLPPFSQLQYDYSATQQHHYYSPISSGSSSPDSSSRQLSVTELSDLWSNSRTGMHQTHSGNIIISALAKAKRKRILPYQYDRLIQVFETTDTPSSETRRQLADELAMTKREVQVWFQNRRAKVNRSKPRQHRHHSSEDISQLPYPTLKRSLSHSSPNKLLEAPYHPSPPKRQNSGIGILASAAEMMHTRISNN